MFSAFKSSLASAVTSVRTGFVPTTVAFEKEGITVVTTALLAEGGYSYVYSAREVSSAAVRSFALKKVLAQDPETHEIGEIEVQLLQRYGGGAHPGFVKCYATTTKELPNKASEFWMLLEFCPNGSLIDVIYKKGKGGAFEKRAPLPTLRVLEIFAEVTAAVVHMHSSDPPMQHRDMKLENVLIAADGRHVLCDFGSATTNFLPAKRTRSEALDEEERIHKYSTLMYRAPEMVDLYRNQEVGPKVDVWALGCILFSLCYGEHPFGEESSLQILNARYNIPTDSKHPPRIQRLVKAVLAPDPAMRPTADTVLEAVQKLISVEKGEAPPTPSTPAANKTATAAAAAAIPPTPSSGFAASDFGADFGSADDFAPTPSPFAAATATAAAAATTARVVTASLSVASASADGKLVQLKLGLFAGGGGGSSSSMRNSGADGGWAASFDDAEPVAEFAADFGSSSSGGAEANAAAAVAAVAAVAKAAEDDDFGDFSSGDPNLVVDASDPVAPATAAADDDDDDDFGEFEVAPAVTSLQALPSHQPFKMTMD